MMSNAVVAEYWLLGLVLPMHHYLRTSYALVNLQNFVQWRMKNKYGDLMMSIAGDKKLKYNNWISLCMQLIAHFINHHTQLVKIEFTLKARASFDYSSLSFKGLLIFSLVLQKLFNIFEQLFSNIIWHHLTTLGTHLLELYVWEGNNFEKIFYLNQILHCHSV